jgi:hypothetical protein
LVSAVGQEPVVRDGDAGAAVALDGLVDRGRQGDGALGKRQVGGAQHTLDVVARHARPRCAARDEQGAQCHGLAGATAPVGQVVVRRRQENRAQWRHVEAHPRVGTGHGHDEPRVQGRSKMKRGNVKYIIQVHSLERGGRVGIVLVMA